VVCHPTRRAVNNPRCAWRGSRPGIRRAARGTARRGGSTARPIHTRNRNEPARARDHGAPTQFNGTASYCATRAGGVQFRDRVRFPLRSSRTRERGSGSKRSRPSPHMVRGRRIAYRDRVNGFEYRPARFGERLGYELIGLDEQEVREALGHAILRLGTLATLPDTPRNSERVPSLTGIAVMARSLVNRRCVGQGTRSRSRERRRVEPLVSRPLAVSVPAGPVPTGLVPMQGPRPEDRGRGHVVS